MSIKTCNKPHLSLEQSIQDILRQVIDPEVGENIVDLGLVYGIEIEGNVANIKLTLTSQACPMGEMLLDDIDATLTQQLSTDIEYDIQMVWEPPWHPDRMSAKAKLRLGWDNA
jgi:metal-sulfur cluster biosynthetic enzyme